MTKSSVCDCQIVMVRHKAKSCLTNASLQQTGNIYRYQVTAIYSEWFLRLNYIINKNWETKRTWTTCAG